MLYPHPALSLWERGLRSCFRGLPILPGESWGEGVSRTGNPIMLRFQPLLGFCDSLFIAGSESQKQHMRVVGTPEIRLSESRVEGGLGVPMGRGERIDICATVAYPGLKPGLLSDVPSGREFQALTL